MEEYTVFFTEANLSTTMSIKNTMRFRQIWRGRNLIVVGVKDDAFFTPNHLPLETN
jgi:hypothetical protein